MGVTSQKLEQGVLALEHLARHQDNINGRAALELVTRSLQSELRKVKDLERRHATLVNVLQQHKREEFFADEEASRTELSEG